MESKQSEKCAWSKPEVVSHGSIETITGWTGNRYREIFCGPGRYKHYYDPPTQTGS